MQDKILQIIQPNQLIISAKSIQNRSTCNHARKRLVASIIIASVFYTAGGLGSSSAAEAISNKTITHLSLDSNYSGQVNNNIASDFKTRLLKSTISWVTANVYELVSKDSVVRYDIDIPFINKTLVISFNHAQLQVNITAEVYQDASQKAFAWAEQEARKKEAKYEASFNAKQQARQDAAAQHALLAMARYNELNNKAYKMGLTTHNRLTEINQTLQTSIDQRAAYKAGVELGRASYKLEIGDRVKTMPDTESSLSLSNQQLIEADKQAESDQLEINVVGENAKQTL
ncbi:hypothetical protein [Paraglaciecola sp.]|uniref:hypothetical protein n=1 Tax=Paraglaciecola sp. TaxID=1920173 RepID=UPI003EF9D24F